MSERAAYLRDGAAIYRRSFAIIRAEADLSRFSPERPIVAVRMIHACGQVDVAQHIVFGRDLVAAARGALAAGAPILCDCRNGGARRHARAACRRDNDVICTLNDPRVAAARAELGTTRSAAALDLWRDRLARRRRGHRQCADGVVPSARHARSTGAPKPAAIIGIPVGFVGAAEFEGGARRRSARRAVPDRARAHGRQRHDGGGGQRLARAGL